MAPDIINRIRSVMVAMVLWTVLTSTLVSLVWFYPVVLLMAAIGVFFLFWAVPYQLRIKRAEAIVSRGVIVAFGVLAAWAILMIVSSFVLMPFLPEGVDLNMGSHPSLALLSLFINIVLFFVILFLPIFLLKIEPGDFYLIRKLNQSNPPYLIRHVPISNSASGNTQQNPGALISSSQREWIRPVDTARLIWRSQNTLLFDENVVGLMTADRQTIDLHLRLLFTFDPRQIVLPEFALQLMNQMTIDDVEKLLLRFINDEVRRILGNHISRLPYQVAMAQQTRQQLPGQLKQELQFIRKMLGVTIDDEHSSVVPLAASQIDVYPASWRDQDRQRLQTMTSDAERGDPISRLLLYLYLLEHPQLQQLCFSEVRENLPISEVDLLLTGMRRDPSFRDEIVNAMLDIYRANPLPAQAAQTGLPSGQQSPIRIEGPDIQLTCTPNRTVSFSWFALDGALVLHWDGQDTVAFYDPQGTIDTGRPYVQRAEYTWNGQRYVLGTLDCRQPPASASSAPPIGTVRSGDPRARRRFMPSRDEDTVNTRRNADGSFEPLDD